MNYTINYTNLTNSSRYSLSNDINGMIKLFSILIITLLPILSILCFCKCYKRIELRIAKSGTLI